MAADGRASPALRGDVIIDIPETAKVHPEQSSGYWRFVPAAASIARHTLSIGSKVFSYVPSGLTNVIGALKTFNLGFVKTDETMFNEANLVLHATTVGDEQLQRVALSQLGNHLALDASNITTAAIGAFEAAGEVGLAMPIWITGAMGVTRVGAIYAEATSHQFATGVLDRLDKLPDDAARLAWLKQQLSDPKFKLAVGAEGVKTVKEAKDPNVIDHVRGYIGKEQVARLVHTAVAAAWIVKLGMKQVTPGYAIVMTGLIAAAEVGLLYYKSLPVVSEESEKLL